MSEPEVTPAPESQDQEPDYDTETLEQIEERFARGEGFIPDEPEPTPAARPEPSEPAAEAEAEPKPVEKVEPEPEPEPDLRDLEMQELRLRLKSQELDWQKERDLASRNAGMVGHLKKQIEALAAGPPQRTEEVEDYAEPAPRRPAPQPMAADTELQTRLAELEQTERGRAIQEEYLQFVNGLRNDMLERANGKADGVEAELQALMEKMSPLINEQIEPYREMELGPSAARRVAKMVLDSAHVKVELARIESMKATARERKATQTARIVKDKQAAAPSGTGSTPGAQPQPKSVDEMTAEEADAAMIAQYGDGRRRRLR